MLSDHITSYYVYRKYSNQDMHYKPHLTFIHSFVGLENWNWILQLFIDRHLHLFSYNNRALSNMLVVLSFTLNKKKRL